MKKQLLILFFSCFFSAFMSAQTGKYWSSSDSKKSKVITDKSVEREGYPKDFKLFDLNLDPLKTELFSVSGKNTSKRNVVITLPNAKGGLEDFEVYETSNFDDELQARFPEIRAYTGKGITDKYATLKLSISPSGIETMVFRADNPDEFIEAYSADHKTYSVYQSQRIKGTNAWSCSTKDEKGANEITNKVNNLNAARFNDGNLRTMRLALSCVGEYAAAFGASTAGNAADLAIVLGRFNATMTRVNGVFEKDFGLHLNIINESTNVIFYDANTDPYSAGLVGADGAWNTELQNTLSSRLTGVGTSLAANNLVYDIGHLFGASGGGGNAGCIGCVCEDDTAALDDTMKGSGFTSPSAGLPQGDNFDIDYVAHEIGHQLGGSHTFSFADHGKAYEIGSGITVMGYAGVTSYDLAAHSIDKFHAKSIEQIQANLVTKACPVVTNIALNNATPVVDAGLDYTIPKSTPFILTGVGNDANAGNALTYSWEQIDRGGPYQGANSNASINKKFGPNWTSLQATASPSRYFPKINSIVANSATTAATGNDAGILTEALSAVSRSLNFRLTVRDNATYSGVAPLSVGQTAFDDMKVTVNDAAGPFAVTAPTNTGISWAAGSSQTVTWNVAGTTGNNVNAAYVDIFLSNDGGLTYPIQLANKVPNDGSETILIPNNTGTNKRIMVKGNNHIFFDISNNNFTITAPPSTFAVIPSSAQTALVSCPGTQNTTSFTFNYSALGGFTGTTSFTATGLPAGTNAVFAPATISANGTVTLTINNLNAAVTGAYNITVTATSGATNKTLPIYLSIGIGTSTLSYPADTSIGVNPSTELVWAAVPNATSYDVQIATNSAFSPVLSTTNVTGTSMNPVGLAQGTTYYWRVLPKNGSCSGNYTPSFRFATANIGCATTSNNTVVAIPASNANGFSTNRTMNIATNAIISDVNVTANITHTYIGDITLFLKSPSGTLVSLFAEGCSDQRRQNLAASFDDSGAAIVCGMGPAPAAVNGIVLPDTPLSIFNGENASGTWTLTLQDAYDGDGGSLNSWSLSICTLQQVPLGTNEFAFSDFSIFPNPNNGSFNIKYTPFSDNVKINVFDISGRAIFEKQYSPSGNFNEIINLQNASRGVYLVSVLDGSKKIVKKIVVE